MDPRQDLLVLLGGVEAVVGAHLEFREAPAEHLGGPVGDAGLAADPVQAVPPGQQRGQVPDPVGAGHALGQLQAQQPAAEPDAVPVDVADVGAVQEGPQVGEPPGLVGDVDVEIGHRDPAVLVDGALDGLQHLGQGEVVDGQSEEAVAGHRDQLAEAPPSSQ